MTSIRTFCLRTSDVMLLRAFFQRHDIDLDLNEEVTADSDAKSLAAAVSKELTLRPRPLRDAILRDMARVEKLTGEVGETALDEQTLTEDAEHLLSRHARVLYIFLYDEPGFRRAEEIVFNDARRGSRQWTAFNVERNLELSRDALAVEKLKQGMRVQFNTANVHLEIFDRVRPELPDEETDEHQTADLVQITIYRETRPNTEFAFIEGELGTQVRHPVLEASMTYEPETGMIECVAAQREDRRDLAHLLATMLLGCNPDFKPVPARAFNLSVLRQRLEFKTEQIDRIEDVVVSMLRLVPVETSAEILTVETTRKRTRDIWSVIVERLGPDALRSDYTITQAKLLIFYRATGSKALQTLPITITHPNRSNLKESTEIERAVANKYLPRWGLVAA